MAPSQKEAIVIILDVGSTVSQSSAGTKSFLEKSRACVSMILQRKLFSNSKDEIALILLGSENTANSLASEDESDGEYQHISIGFQLSTANWKMIEFVEEQNGSDVPNADWIDAVVVALQFLKDEIKGSEYAEKKIVLFTDFATSVSDDQVDVIIKGMKKLGVELDVIGPDVIPKTDVDESDDSDMEGQNHKENGATGTAGRKPKTEVQEAGEALAARMVTELKGIICSFDDAIPQLIFFQKRPVKPAPWNVVMEIGSEIKIPITGYKKITEATLPSWKNMIALDDVAYIEKERSYFRCDENQTAVEKEDVISGFRFGSTLVPFSDEDKENMSYVSGERGLRVLGFTKAGNIPRHLIVGAGVLYVVPRKDHEQAAILLSSLIRALKDLDMVAVARKVYSKNSSPFLGAMFPEVTDEFECLVFVELPYSEDLRHIRFPSLNTEKNKPTEEQLDAVDKLIDNMDLMTAIADEDEEPSEAFDPTMIPNPYFQHLFRCMTHRVLHPGEKLPDPEENILQLLSPLPGMSAACRTYVEQIRTLFPLEEIIHKDKKGAADIFKDQTDAGPSGVQAQNGDLSDITMADLTKSDVVAVGTVNPAGDFVTLIDRGENFDEVCKQLQKVIVNLVMQARNSDTFKKPEDALKKLRESCIKNPSIYNDWIVQVKEMLLERGKKDFWEAIVEGNLGLITKEESPKSTTSPEDAKKFFEVESEVKGEIKEDDVDVDDLLDEM